MTETKRVVIGFLVPCFILIGLLRPERMYAESNIDFLIKNRVLTKYRGTGGDVVISDGVTEIGKHMFYNCNSLKDVTIPNSITQIGDSAFSFCDSLIRIIAPSPRLSTAWTDKYTFIIYQLTGGDKPQDFRFKPYDRLQAAGLAVDPGELRQYLHRTP